VQSLSPAAGEGKTLPLIKQMTLIQKGLQLTISSVWLAPSENMLR
jgi:hypothetical protein